MKNTEHFDSLMKPGSFVRDSHLVCINSVMCTGTHFTRYALEESDLFYYCINTPMETGDGVMLHDYYIKLASTCCTKVKFYSKYIEVLNDEKVERVKVAQHTEYNGKQFKKKDKSKVKYLLFSCHSCYATRVQTFGFPFKAFVIPVRHPLLSVVSLLRRHGKSQGERLIEMMIWEWIYCAKFIWLKDYPCYVFINPWSITGFGRLFKRLDVRMSENVRNFVEIKQTLVNETQREDTVGTGKTLTSKDSTDDDTLEKARKNFIENGRVDSSISKYHDLLVSSGCMKIYTNLCKRNGAQLAP